MEPIDFYIASGCIWHQSVNAKLCRKDYKVLKRDFLTLSLNYYKIPVQFNIKRVTNEMNECRNIINTDAYIVKQLTRER